MLRPTGRAALLDPAYPPRERWVPDAAAYKPAESLDPAYPPRQRWVLDAAAYKTNDAFRHICRLQHHEPTSHEVGMSET